MRVGVLLNPVAGFGGALALHGSDDLSDDRYADAVAAGRAARRLLRALDRFAPAEHDVELLVAPGVLGADALSKGGIVHTVLTTGALPARTTREHTVDAARRLRAEGVDCLVFAGGDGTATDLVHAVGEELPVVGVPSGVKMHSEVFARSPEAAGRLLGAFVEGRTSLEPAEVLDVGARGETGVVGVLRVPRSHEPLQGAKSLAPPNSSAVAARAIAEALVSGADPATTWIIGPGTTTGAVATALGFTSTLRGVDVRHAPGGDSGEGGDRVELDVPESRLHDIVRGAERPLLVLGVVGGQGFLLGRGNQQISRRVIEALGADRVEILATQEKIGALSPPILLIDGEEDAAPHPLLGYRRVRTASRRSTVLKVVDAAA